MSFQYHRNKSEQSGDSFWTSYSDLFLGLSTIFLLLYVVTSFRTGTDGLKHQMENEKMNMQIQDLQNQLKLYEAAKTDYLEKANKDEQQEYTELMDKLSLLQEEAKDENDRLKKEALENELKAKSLNKYQQMVRNIINANKFAKNKINVRDDIIVDQEGNINSLNSEVAKNQRLITENERKISETNKELDSRLRQLKSAYASNRMSKKIYNQKLAQAQQDAQNRVSQLQRTTQKYQSDIVNLNQKMQAVSGQLQQTQGQLEQTAGALQEKTNQVGNLQNQLASSVRETEGKIAALKAGFENQKAGDRAQFEGELRRMQLGAAERAKREGEFRAAAAAKEQEMRGRMAGLQGELDKARAELEARQAVANEIKKGFAKAGIKADIDGETGEVLLDFGQHYFEVNSANLKSEMKAVLQKAMPIYSKSLFGNPKISNKISSVEVIGFASPTYKNRFIDPKSSRPEDIEALKYNMDLSYQRANSIFQYVLQEKDLNFQHKKDLLPLMKVSGRSFLEAFGNQSRSTASTAAEFCKLNDCKKAQRVIIRFSLDKK
jgi:myosin heavy subunit